MSETNDVNDWNRRIMDEFRANDGAVGGMFEGRPMLILHTVGRRTGTARVNPLAYLAVPDGWAIIGSKAGAASHPDWFHNIVANPEVSIEVGSDTIEVRARVAEGDERDRIWTTQKSEAPQFAGYEEAAGDRLIPVVVLERR